MQAFQFDINLGIASFLPAKAKPVDIAAFQADVKASGFELLWLEAEVRGSLQITRNAAGDKRHSVLVAGSGQIFVLNEGTTVEERNSYANLEEWSNGASRSVVVSGRIHSVADAEVALTIRNCRLAR